MSSDQKSEPVIPPITEPMGAHWRQPARDAILVDDVHAVMTELTFRQLAEYSCSMPSGVYPGKMWRRHDGAHDPRCTSPTWLLCWFSEGDSTDRCRINYRPILLLQERPLGFLEEGAEI